MRKFITLTTLFIILLLGITFQQEISNFLVSNFIFNKKIIIEDANQYKLNYNFLYLGETDNFYPNNKKDLINIIYTVLNNGWENFTFYCSEEYVDCIDDVEEISRDPSFLSLLNNFVHPFNSYNVIYTNYNTLGRVTLKIDKVYHENEIEILEKKVDELYSELINDKMNTKEKILTIHDYIVNNTSYDNERADAIVNNNTDYVPIYQSHKAVGPLIQHMAICGGYSDAMSLFLIKMNIPNYKISNDDHVWNYVYLNNNWYHLDLTWDDPVTNTNEDLLIHDYFLITTEELFKLKNNHQFNEEVFIEATLK